MYKHIVLWKIRDDIEADAKPEQISKARAMLNELPAQIDGIERYEVGVNTADYAASFFDFSLYSVFRSREAFEKYCQHPEHDKVVAYITGIVDEERIVDYDDEECAA